MIFSLCGFYTVLLLLTFIYSIDRNRELIISKLNPIQTEIEKALFVEDVYKIKAISKTISNYTNDNSYELSVFNKDGDLIGGPLVRLQKINEGLTIDWFKLNVTYRANLMAAGVNLGTLIIIKKYGDNNLIILFLVSLITLFIIGTLLLFLARRLNSIIQSKIVNPILQIHSDVLGQTKIEDISGDDEIIEISEIRQSLIVFHKKLKTVLDQEIIIKISSQVAHDIRSPLSALNMMLGSIVDLPEEKRLIIRSATQRINDIANGLIKYGKELSNKNNNVKLKNNIIEPIMLVAIIDNIISEKRVQFRENINVDIQGNLNNGYGIFVKINPSDFTRVISNLINNSVEASENSVNILIEIIEEEGYGIVKIIDNGKGIPENIINKLGQKGYSFGKQNTDSGSGLGLYHAKETIENADGKIKISSKIGYGTTVEISLPVVNPPIWFLEKIIINKNDLILSLDDDQTIHQIWSEKIGTSHVFKDNLRHLKFTSISQFLIWYNSNNDEVKYYLVDYEFLGQSENGLNLIERLEINSNSILVTSRYDEVNVQKKAIALGVKILPKSLAAIVPIIYQKDIN